MPDWQSLIPEERQLFGKYVHDLRKKDKWLSVEQAQQLAYQIVLAESMKGFDQVTTGAIERT
jgi:hypothetical protein